LKAPPYNSLSLSFLGLRSTIRASEVDGKEAWNGKGGAGVTCRQLSPSSGPILICNHNRLHPVYLGNPRDWMRCPKILVRSDVQQNFVRCNDWIHWMQVFGRRYHVIWHGMAWRLSSYLPFEEKKPDTVRVDIWEIEKSCSSYL
jgi:hypothetical protein